MSEVPALQPFDEYNQTLQSHVAPADWQNPEPPGRYNLVVVGAGTAGLVTASVAAGLGAKVALIERQLMGGDCLNVGCVPSKGMLSAARVAATVRQAGDYGIRVPGTATADFAAVMQRMRRLRAGISPHDSARRFTDLGVDVYLGHGQFTGSDTLQVDDRVLKFRRAVICTGARAAELPIPGWDEVNPLTNETVFSLTELPPRLAVIGGGPIGCEMAQAFARLGSQVTQIEKHPRILSKDEPDAAEILQSALQRDGVRLLLNARITRLEQRGAEAVVWYRQADTEHQCVVDKVLIGIGRAPNVEDMGLDAAGVRFDVRRGVIVNDRLQTSNSIIFAAGDVCSEFKFTHAADFMARTVIGNALFYGRSRLSALTIPWCTYTSPEVAHIGLTAQQAQQHDLAIDTYEVALEGVDRAILDGSTEGFVRAHVRKGTDQLVGATIVADNAGDMIGELSLAMTATARVPRWKKLLRLSSGTGLAVLGLAIHPYPTQAEAIRKLGDQYSRTRLTPIVKAVLQRWLKFTR